jgi:hypothetical protein
MTELFWEDSFVSLRKKGFPLKFSRYRFCHSRAGGNPLRLWTWIPAGLFQDELLRLLMKDCIEGLLRFLRSVDSRLRGNDKCGLGLADPFLLME